MVVVVTGIIAIGLAPSVEEREILIGAIGGVIVGGIVVVLAGIVKTRCVRRPKQEDKDTASKA